LYRKGPKKRSTGRKENMPRGIRHQKRKGIMSIMAKRKNTVTKAATARQLDTTTEVSSTNRNNKITGHFINVANFP
jgi:hypothetical protein